ncbi:acyl-CoA-binding domain-containing protein 4 isoform X2 [Mercurialis annua]|uniref:acyl-CoA-binding domain-containing protein 4 isoform X2 n=1 Tax=Mercurialis annua TaxID=3986 RepID=UPI00215F83B1|nr:acyl-CoA-binding domain-containing protein 4 isoform X2 [Mercurialis annua]
MFSFSGRRMKLGRVKKVQLSDSTLVTRSPIRPQKRTNNSNSEGVAATTSISDELDCPCSSAPPEVNSSTTSANSENWMVLSISGDKPAPRFNHAATVIGNKMIVVGGESGNGLLDDVQVLNFDHFTWTTISSKLYLSPSSLPLKIPACKGHSLVAWGKKALLVGGKTDPASDRISVWAFDTESECWSLLEAKGDVPVSRSGHTVVRASSVLILFGGEDAKRRKLNDLHMFDLKSFTWLPLHCTGTGPSPRCNHVAALYDDKMLYIFGGTSKSRSLNDLYSLDFETMVWSKIKIRGFHPSPRAGCCGVLCGTKWYIAGGGSRKKRHSETLIFDILKVEWSVAFASSPSSITVNKGFSLVLVQHKEKDFLVAFGGLKKEPSNQVEVMGMDKNESSMSRQSAASKGAGPLFGKRSSSAALAVQLSTGSSQRSVDSLARQHLVSADEHHGSGRKSLSEPLVDPNSVSGNVSLRKQFHAEEHSTNIKTAKSLEDGTFSSPAMEHKRNQSDTSTQTTISIGDNEDVAVPECDGATGGAYSSVYQLYETKIASVIRKNGNLEAQLAAALASREGAEKNLSSVLKSKQEIERKLTDTVREMELLREKLAGVELAQEEANSLSNIVHSDNVRLEHDVAFLKAVLDDTQKELHSTRGVLAGERARAFQLQVEVFHLKQRLQSMENRVPTPRKPFNV